MLPKCAAKIQPQMEQKHLNMTFNSPYFSTGLDAASLSSSFPMRSDTANHMTLVFSNVFSCLVALTNLEISDVAIFCP